MSKLPPVSVVIPSYNGQKLLEKHLPQVLQILNPGDEIVVVDDASTDDTVAWIAEQASQYEKRGITLRVVRHEKNQRFAAAVNTGVKHATHGYVLLLNNDVSPLSSDLLEQLFSFFTDQLCFAVGCAEVRSNKPKAQVFGRGTGGWKRGLLMHWYDPDQDHTATLWTSGGSMLFHKEKYEKIGGMDTIFYPAYEEDRDLSYRALKHGWRLAFAYNARVLHQHETTNQTAFGQRKMETVSWKNQYLLVWKNITDRDLLLNHLLWLPYHLLISGWRSHGTSILGFFQALKQLPAALRARRKVLRLWKLSDQEVLSPSREK